MKILYAGMKYDYGQPFRGFSFEHLNFYLTLVDMGHQVLYFDFLTLIGENGKEGMNRALLDTVRDENPDLLFCCLFEDEFLPDTIREISGETDTLTFNWFSDDHWRFEDFSRRWAPCFNYVSTTDRDSLASYRSIGYEGVLLTQWACNPAAYPRKDVPCRYDVSFIGQPHGDRREIISECRKAGLDVETFGFGWEGGLLVRGFNKVVRKMGLVNLQRLRGRVSHEEMLEIFWGSRINLNLTNSSVERGKPQIKGRNFEVPGIGGFLLTEYAPGIEEYFEPDREIVCYGSVEELIDKAKYYLAQEEERESIRARGYERAVSEHTYEKRFRDLFGRMDLK